MYLPVIGAGDVAAEVCAAVVILKYRIIHARCQNSRAPIDIRFTMCDGIQGRKLDSKTLAKRGKRNDKINQSRYHVY